MKAAHSPCSVSSSHSSLSSPPPKDSNFRFFAFISDFSPAASCSPPATRTQSLLELRAAPSDLPPERNGFQLILFFRLIHEFFAQLCFHLCTQFLHGNLGVVKHLQLLLKPHLKLLLFITPSTWNELIHTNELCWA